MPPTESELTRAPELAGLSLTARQLVEVLIRHYGLHEGKYELVLGFQIGAGPIGPQPRSRMPGIIIGLQSVGIAVAKAGAEDAVDAASVSATPTTTAAPET